MTTEETNHIIDEMIAIDSFSSSVAFANVQSKIRQGQRTKKRMQVRRGMIATLSVAAMLTLVFLFGNKPMVVFNDGQEVLVQTLPDGSTLYLNKGAEIRYSSRMSTNRTVTLTGEAFFEVVPDASHPFSVLVAGSKVTVLGTSFNVRNTKGTSEVEVFVKTGKVNLSNQHKDVDLSVDDFGMVYDGEVMMSELQDVNYMAWKDKKLVFDGDDLVTVIDAIAQCYQVDITLASTVSPSKQITTTFEGFDLEAVLRSICLTLNLEYSKTSQGYLVFQE